MGSRKHVAFFSQTGKEIVDISKQLGRWPDLIVTNERPEQLRTISQELKDRVTFISNKPTVEELELVLSGYEDAIITLHGWLRIMPAQICEKYNILNGHPGLITKYPELKGKDPQERAYIAIQKGEMTQAGCVLHKVTAGVDEGKVLMKEYFNVEGGISLDELYNILRDRSLYLWVKFFKEVGIYV